MYEAMGRFERLFYWRVHLNVNGRAKIIDPERI